MYHSICIQCLLAQKPATDITLHGWLAMWLNLSHAVSQSGFKLEVGVADVLFRQVHIRGFW